jgi:hypothetical protein
MQLKDIQKGWKPVTLAVGLMAGASGMYAELDQYSHIDTVLTNHATSRYISEINDPSELMMNGKLMFDALESSWRKETRFLSSVNDIINQRDFQAIISMGNQAVPFIGRSIEAQPSTLVWALNMIFKGKISEKKDLTITEACKLWVKELKRQGWM